MKNDAIGRAVVNWRQDSNIVSIYLADGTAATFGVHCPARLRNHDATTAVLRDKEEYQLAATLRCFTAGGAIHIAVRQLSQTWKLRHYDVITRKL